MKLAYCISAPGSLLRHLMAQSLHYQYSVCKWGLIGLCETFMGCEDLLADYLKLLKTHQENETKPTDPLKTRLCTWHKHADGVECRYKARML